MTKQEAEVRKWIATWPKWEQDAAELLLNEARGIKRKEPNDEAKDEGPDRQSL